MKLVWKTLGQIWMAPITFAGVILALVCRSKFAGINGPAIEFVAREGSLVDRFFKKYRMAAFTWGACVTYAQPKYLKFDWLRAHEHHHTYQCMYLGPFAPITYGVASLIAKIRGKNAYHDNWFERDARKAAGQE